MRWMDISSLARCQSTFIFLFELLLQPLFLSSNRSGKLRQFATCPVALDMSRFLSGAGELLAGCDAVTFTEGFCVRVLEGLWFFCCGGRF